MKKIFLSIIITVIAYSANAQIGYGLKAGLNYSQISGDNNGDQKFKAGYSTGVFVNIPFKKIFAIQPEILYSTEGATIDGAGTLDLKYINVPIMFQYKKNGLYGEVGPQIGFNTVANAVSSTATRDFKGSIESTSFALNIGGGYILNNGIGINLRYSQGLTNIYKANDPIVGNTVNQNAVFTLGLSYKFGAK